MQSSSFHLIPSQFSIYGTILSENSWKLTVATSSCKPIYIKQIYSHTAPILFFWLVSLGKHDNYLNHGEDQIIAIQQFHILGF